MDTKLTSYQLQPTNEFMLSLLRMYKEGLKMFGFFVCLFVVFLFAFFFYLVEQGMLFSSDDNQVPFSCRFLKDQRMGIGRANPAFVQTS